MEDRNCELLFEYLRSILYDSEVKTLEIDSLDVLPHYPKETFPALSPPERIFCVKISKISMRT